MTAAVLTNCLDPRPLADRALSLAGQFWLVVAVIGQWAFFYYIVAFYGVSTLQGNIAGWSRNQILFKGYVPGDTAGNIAFGAHALLAGIIAFGGAVQLIPQLRARFPAVHRWNGRVFVVTALMVSVTGLYMIWVRGSNPSLLGKIATSLNAALIIGFVVLAWRAAASRRIAIHRRWALRLYLVSNAQWFMRVGFFAWMMIARGMLHLPKAWGGVFFDVWSFGCVLVPIAVLELYLRAQDGAGPRGRFAMAGGLVALTLVMAVGAFGFSMFSKGLLTGAAG
jgi:hypothetical protein